MAPWFSRALAWLGLRRSTERRTAYAGAATNRLTADWILATSQSADQEIRGDVRTLRARAREMVRNNSYAARFVGMVAENVIGPRGVTLQARVEKWDGALKDGANAKIEAAWRRWCEPETASADGRLSFSDIETLAVQTLAQDGEFLLRMLPGFGNDFGFSLQVLDPDLLDLDYNAQPEGGRGEVRMGVEVDAWGRPVAYHLFTRHPGDYTAQGRERVRVPAEQVIHGFLTRRPGQSRGVTWFAPVLTDARMLAGYQEAELVAARTSAAKMGFIKMSPEAVMDPNAPQAAGPATMEAAPGVVDRLLPGEDFVPWDPQHPASAYSAFTKGVLRSIATGLGVSYTSLANDLEAVNYSSIRAGLLAERDVWKRLQVWLACHLHRRVYNEWLRWALVSGALELPSSNPDRYRQVEWQFRGWAWVDPLKDIQAAKEAVALGLDSRTRLAAEAGREFEEIVADLERENRIAADAGVNVQGVTNGNQGAAEADADDGAGARPLRAVRGAA